MRWSLRWRRRLQISLRSAGVESQAVKLGAESRTCDRGGITGGAHFGIFVGKEKKKGKKNHQYQKRGKEISGKKRKRVVEKGKKEKYLEMNNS